MGSVTTENILASFPSLVEWFSGDRLAVATRPCSSADPQAGSLCFCPEQKQLQTCFLAKVAILVIPPQLADAAEQLSTGRSAILISHDLQAAMAILNARFFLPNWGREPFGELRIHPSAHVHPSARLHETAVVQPNAVIGPEVSIEAGSIIGANSTLEGNISIGKRCVIKANVFIGHSVQMGDDCRIEPQSAIGTDGYGYGTDKHGEHHAKPHFGKVILGNRVEIGCGVSIDRGTFEDTVIGDGTKIDNQCHFAHNTIVGKNCLITAGFMVAGSSTFGDNCKFAGRVSANGHITVCDDVTMGPVSVISKNITTPGFYGGFPPVPYKDFVRNQASTASMFDTRKRVNELWRKINPRS